MSHVFTVKLPHPLLYRLEALSVAEGVSKGSLIRRAIAQLIELQAAASTQVERVTECLRRHRPSPITLDWKKVYAQTRTSGLVSPEEEVRRHRQRGL